MSKRAQDRDLISCREFSEISGIAIANIQSAIKRGQLQAKTEKHPGSGRRRLYSASLARNVAALMRLGISISPALCMAQDLKVTALADGSVFLRASKPKYRAVMREAQRWAVDGERVINSFGESAQ